MNQETMKILDRTIEAGASVYPNKENMEQQHVYVARAQPNEYVLHVVNKDSQTAILLSAADFYRLSKLISAMLG